MSFRTKLALPLTALLFFVPIVSEAQDAQVATETPAIITPAVLPAELGLRSERIPGGDRVIGDFVIGPGKVELELLPGQKRTVELTITNRTGEERDFLFDIEDAVGTADGSQAVVLLGDDIGPYTLKEFIKLPAERIRVAHGERVRVPVTVDVPTDAEPISRYGSVLVKTVAVEADDGLLGGVAAQLPVVARVGTLFFVTVPGEIERAGELEDFTTIPPARWVSGGPVTFGITFKNTGSVHLNPYGELRVRNIFGEEVAYQTLDPWFALPQSTRTREVEWNGGNLLGYYTATIEINRGYDDVIDSQDLWFIVVPWKLLLMVFGGLLVIVFGLRFLFSRFEFKRKS